MKRQGGSPCLFLFNAIPKRRENTKQMKYTHLVLVDDQQGDEYYCVSFFLPELKLISIHIRGR